MNILLPLLLSVSVYCLGYGLWMGYWDLYPVRPDEKAVSTPPDEELLISDRVTLRLAVACSLLLHAGIVGLLLLAGDIPPGENRFPGAKPIVPTDDFYVFLTSLPEEKKHPFNASPVDSRRPTAQPRTRSFPVRTATRVTVEAVAQRPAPPRAMAVAGAPAGDSTNEGPPLKMVAKEVPTAAPPANDEASPRHPTKRERVVELSSVRVLKPAAERLVAAAPLSSSVHNGQPEPLQTQSAAVPPASQLAPEAPPLPVPEGSAVASQPLDAGPAFFPPPGTVIAEQPPTSPSPANSAAPGLRQGESGSPPIVVAARPSSPEPPAQSQETQSAETQTLKAVPAAELLQEAVLLPPTSKGSASTPEVKRQPSPPAEATLQGPNEVAFHHSAKTPTASQPAREPPPVPTSGHPAVIVESPEVGPALFPPPGTMVEPRTIARSAPFPAPGAVMAARDATVSAPLNGEVPRPPTSERTEVRQETQLAEIQTSEALPPSPVEESTPVRPIPQVSPQDPDEKPDPSSSTDPTLREPEGPSRAVSVAASPDSEVASDPATVAPSDGTGVAPELAEGGTRIAAGLSVAPEPLAESQAPTSAESEMPEPLPTAEFLQEAAPRPPISAASLQPPEVDPLPARSADATRMVSGESPNTRLGTAFSAPAIAPELPPVPDTDTTAVVARSRDASPGLFPPPGTAIAAQSTPSSPPPASSPPRSHAPAPNEIRQRTRVAALEASERLPSELERSSLSDRNPGKSDETAVTDSVTAASVPEGGPGSSSAPAQQASVIATRSLGTNTTLFPSPGAVVEPRLFASAESTPSALGGRGFSRLEVRLDGPRTRVTDHEIEIVSGKVLGGLPAQFVLYVNNTEREAVADEGSFEVSVSLRRGLNRLRAAATDWRGMKTEDSITIEYVPPPVPNGIAITSPQDGHTLPSDAAPVIIVEGRVEDWNVSTISLVANDRRIAVRAHNGRFRKILPVLDPVLHLWAELPPNGKPPQRSERVTVHAGSSISSHGLLVMDWPQGVASNQLKVKATWRARPERLDIPVQRVLLNIVGQSSKDPLPEAFYLRMRPGVYTFLLRAHTGLAADVRATLYLPEANRLEAREIRPVSLNGRTEVVLAKVLLPQGVFWEQDEWFTGQSESADTVTKFRFPEGISWTERKENLQ